MSIYRKRTPQTQETFKKDSKKLSLKQKTSTKEKPFSDKKNPSTMNWQSSNKISLLT